MTEQDENDRLKSIAALKDAQLKADQEKLKDQPAGLNEKAAAYVVSESNQGYSPSPAEQKNNPALRKFVADGEVVVPDKDCDPAALAQMKTDELREKQRQAKRDTPYDPNSIYDSPRRNLPVGKDEKDIREMAAHKTLDKTGTTTADPKPHTNK